MTSLHIFTSLPFTITVLHLHVIDGLHVLLQVPVPGVLHGWHDPYRWAMGIIVAAF